jgi:alpha-L-fucosidase
MASSEGGQITINNCCGILSSDFDSPEYTTFSSISERRWESNQGMDPLYSYGYNRATPPSLYMNASTLIYSQADMVSKNGNLLLDVGPMADGTIDATEVVSSYLPIAIT